MKKAIGSERQSGLPSLHGIFRAPKFMVHLNLLNQNNFIFSIIHQFQNFSVWQV
jgi:hypothetical protein